MTGRLAHYSILLADAQRRAFPDLPAYQGQCIPIFDLSLGDIGSDMALSIAGQLRQPVNKIAARLIEHLPDEIKKRVTVASGFVNIHLDPSELVDWEPSGVDQTSGATLQIYVSSGTGLTESSAFRLLCAAILQRELAASLGLAASVRAGEVELLPPGQPLTREILCHSASFAGSSNVLQNLERITRPRTFWIHPDFLSRSDFGEFYKQCIAGDPQSALRCPPRAWFLIRPEYFEDREKRAISRASLPAILFYLAQSIDAGDIDFAVPSLEESANVWWQLNVTVKRMSRWKESFSGALPADRSLPPDLTAGDILFLRRRKFIRTFLERAAKHGEVENFLGALTQLLTLAEQRLNHPDLRLELERGRLSVRDLLVLSGVFEIFSDMINRIRHLEIGPSGVV